MLSPSCATGCCASAVTSGDAAWAEGRLGSETSPPPTAVEENSDKGEPLVTDSLIDKPLGAS